MAKTKTKNVKAKPKAKPKPGKVTKKDLVIQFHAKGFTSQEIAEKAGTTLNSVRWYLSKEGLKANRE